MFRQRGRVAATVVAIFNAELSDISALLVRRSLEHVVLRGSGEEEDVSRGDTADGGSRRDFVVDGGVTPPATLGRRSVARVYQVHRGDVSVLQLPALCQGGTDYRPPGQGIFSYVY